MSKYFSSIIHVLGIDPEKYSVLETMGFVDKSDAYNVIREYWSDVQGVTVLFRDGLYYIVQSHALVD